MTATGEILLDENGDVELIVGTIQDITDSKKAEEKLRLSEEQYRSLAENSQDYIMRYDL